MSKELPAHIAAALRGAGGAADTGGQQWAGRDLTGGDYHRFSQDDGATSPELSAALSALRDGSGGEAGVLAALAQARVFVPIVAEVAASEITEDGLIADKEADMALVRIAAPDGRAALPVFSNVQALQRWHAGARPVAVYAPRAALSAVSEQAELVVLDPGADLTFVVRRPAVWALAQQYDWIPSYADQELLAALTDKSEQWFDEAAPGILRAVRFDRAGSVDSQAANGQRIPGGGHGPELCVTLELAAGLGQGDLSALVGAFNEYLSTVPEVAQRVDSLQLVLQQAR